MGIYSDLMGFYSDLMGYYWYIPSGKRLQKAIENHPFLMGKSTIMGNFQ